MTWSEVAAKLEERDLLEDITEIVCAHHVTVFEALGRQRTTKVVEARHAAWSYLDALGFSTTEIGGLWGVDHASVSLALRKRAVKR